MAAPRQAFSVSIARVEDVDEFVETVRGYHLGFMQIDKGPFVAEAAKAQLAEVLRKSDALANR
jgi:hypothetical protein